jgi:CheY-like chemotaxis protein
VDTTIDGREALTLLGKNKYDIVISDMKMPTLSGAKFYEMIKERYPNMAKKVIFITGDLFNIETKEFLENTNNPYLIKPFKLTELRETIKKALNMK